MSKFVAVDVIIFQVVNENSLDFYLLIYLFSYLNLGLQLVKKSSNALFQIIDESTN